MGSNEMRVMLLRCADRGMPQEFLHCSDVSTLGEQLHSECVTEAVRVGVNLGDRAQALDGAPCVFDAGGELAVARPKEVLGIDDRQSIQRRDRVRVQQHFKAHTGL